MAAVYFHRFYMFHSFTNFHRYVCSGIFVRLLLLIRFCLIIFVTESADFTSLLDKFLAMFLYNLNLVCEPSIFKNNL